MNIYVELLLVALIVTYIVALSGWTETWLGWLGKLLKGPVRSFRPFSCAQCMTWWCCLAWCLVRHRLELPLVAASAGIAFFSLTLENVCISIREGLLKLLDLFNRWITRD